MTFLVQVVYVIIHFTNFSRHSSQHYYYFSRLVVVSRLHQFFQGTFFDHYLFPGLLLVITFSIHILEMLNIFADLLWLSQLFGHPTHFYICYPTTHIWTGFGMCSVSTVPQSKLCTLRMRVHQCMGIPTPCLWLTNQSTYCDNYIFTRCSFFCGFLCFHWFAVILISYISNSHPLINL